MDSERVVRVILFLIVFLAHQLLQEHAWQVHIGEIADPIERTDLWSILSIPVFFLVPPRIQFLHFQELLIANSVVWGLAAMWLASLFPGIAGALGRRSVTLDVGPAHPPTATRAEAGQRTTHETSGARRATGSPSSRGFRTLGDGRYELLAAFARGGFGTVHRARDRVRQLDVAIKTLDIDSIPESERDRFRDTFQREAALAARLDHHGIVAVLDHDAYSEVPYIVMSLMTGGTLRQRLDALPPSKHLHWVEVVEIGTQIAQALEYARQRGVAVHRDVKPGNIFRGDSGYKLGDFGVARAATDPRSEHVAGAGAGTRGYMAPEQVLAAPAVDWRADLFSLCVVLYEALTGRVPYSGSIGSAPAGPVHHTLQPIMDAASGAVVPLRTILPDLPVHVAKAIERGLHFDRVKRFNSWEEFIHTLRGEPRLL